MSTQEAPVTHTRWLPAAAVAVAIFVFALVVQWAYTASWTERGIAFACSLFASLLVGLAIAMGEDG